MSHVLEIRGSAADMAKAIILRMYRSRSRGEIFALLGKNGNGQEYALKTALGFLRARFPRFIAARPDVTGRELQGRPAVPLPIRPRRGSFQELTVEENLRLVQPPAVGSRPASSGYPNIFRSSAKT